MNNLPDIYELENLLQDADASYSAAESHGILCGMLCTKGVVDAPQWLLRVLGEQQVSNDFLQKAGRALLEVHKLTVEQMNSSDMAFELLLPDDEARLEERVEALGFWCQGFSYGLVLGGLKEETKMPENCIEVLTDIIEIARVGYFADDEGLSADDELNDDEESDSEEDEVAFVEVSEYVRMSALLIYEELQPLQSSQTVH